MAERSPGPGSPARMATVVQLDAARVPAPATSYHMVSLQGASVLLVHTVGDSRTYLFPPEILSSDVGLLLRDPADLVRAGAGVEIAALIGSGRMAALAQAVAICRARQQAGHLQRPRRRPRGAP